MNLIFLGQQGAGKGTFAQYLGNTKGLIQISAGDLLRAEVKTETDTGKKAKEIMNQGLLVPDELVAELIEKKIEKEKDKGIILDGYPRTLKQAELLENIINQLNLKINAVINFTISDETTFERIGGRITCKKCNKVYHEKFLPPKEKGKCDECGEELIIREDDTRHAIMKRLEEYKKQTKPLIDYYRKKGLLKEVNAEPILDKIKPEFDEIIKKIEN